MWMIVWIIIITFKSGPVTFRHMVTITQFEKKSSCFSLCVIHMPHLSDFKWLCMDLFCVYHNTVLNIPWHWLVLSCLLEMLLHLESNLTQRHSCLHLFLPCITAKGCGCQSSCCRHIIRVALAINAIRRRPCQQAPTPAVLHGFLIHSCFGLSFNWAKHYHEFDDLMIK